MRNGEWGIENGELRILNKKADLKKSAFLFNIPNS
jgi:hypothetical protein